MIVCILGTWLIPGQRTVVYKTQYNDIYSWSQSKLDFLLRHCVMCVTTPTLQYQLPSSYKLHTGRAWIL